MTGDWKFQDEYGIPWSGLIHAIRMVREPDGPVRLCIGYHESPDRDSGGSAREASVGNGDPGRDAAS